MRFATELLPAREINVSAAENANREIGVTSFRIDFLAFSSARGEKTGDTGVEESTMTEPTKEELLARIAELEKQTGGAKRSGALEFRVGEKGGVSVYGLGRFPVTLYYEQWIRLLDVGDGLRTFLEENKHRLKLKT
jgi:hypothetical protein